MNGFVINGLDPSSFRAFYNRSDADLALHEVRRIVATENPGFPCRITLEDIPIGSAALLLNYEHHGGNTAYRQSHAVFVREGAEMPARYENRIPKQLAIRLLSVRAYNGVGDMVTAEVVEGSGLSDLIAQLFADPSVAFLHAHNAKPGCFAARIDRAA